MYDLFSVISAFWSPCPRVYGPYTDVVLHLLLSQTRIPRWHNANMNWWRLEVSTNSGGYFPMIQAPIKQQRENAEQPELNAAMEKKFVREWQENFEFFLLPNANCASDTISFWQVYVQFTVKLLAWDVFIFANYPKFDCWGTFHRGAYFRVFLLEHSCFRVKYLGWWNIYRAWWPRELHKF